MIQGRAPDEIKVLPDATQSRRAGSPSSSPGVTGTKSFTSIHRSTSSFRDARDFATAKEFADRLLKMNEKNSQAHFLMASGGHRERVGRSSGDEPMFSTCGHVGTLQELWSYAYLQCRKERKDLEASRTPEY